MVQNTSVEGGGIVYSTYGLTAFRQLLVHIYVFYMFYISVYRFYIRFYMFSTEEVRLATGASAPVARKEDVFLFISFNEGKVKGMYTVFK